MDLRKERTKLRVKNYLLVLGRVYEGELRMRISKYPAEFVTKSVDELCAEGFCKRVPHNNAQIVVLTGAPLEDLRQI